MSWYHLSRSGPPEEFGKVSTLLSDQSWYFRNWRLDPTVQSAPVDVLDHLPVRTAGMLAHATGATGGDLRAGSTLNPATVEGRRGGRSTGKDCGQGAYLEPLGVPLLSTNASPTLARNRS